MDLTMKYMELQGTLGYLHRVDSKFSYNYVIGYSTEGSTIQYLYYDKPEEVVEAVERWGKTGDLIIDEFDMIAGKVKQTIEHPTTVRVLETTDVFRRRMYPPEVE